MRVLSVVLCLSPLLFLLSSFDAHADGPAEIDPGDAVLDGYRGALVRWVEPKQREAVGRISTMATGPAGDERLSRMLRYELFRRIGGPAILATRIPQLRRYGREISRLPAWPNADWEAAMSARMNLDSAFIVVGDLIGDCMSEPRGANASVRSEADARAISSECSARYAPASSAVSAAWTFLRELDVETMTFDDSAGEMLGDGEVSSAPPRLLSSALEDASGSLPRARVRRVAVAILRAMIRDAHRQMRSGVGPPD